jgi:SAM-dependent methyltransferase
VTDTDAPSAAPPLEAASSLGPFAWLLHKQPDQPAPELVRSGAADDPDDLALVRRIMSSYRRSCEGYHSSGSFWDRAFVELKAEIHRALIGNDEYAAAALLRNPAETTLFWGFDAIAKAPEGSIEPHQNVIQTLNPTEDWKRLYAFWLLDALSSAAQAMGTRRVPYPETQPDQVGVHEASKTTADRIMDQIDEAVGFSVCFPNPFPGELGLLTRRGVIGFRAVQSLYQAWRIARIADGNKRFRVLEIGAGLGRTAYFASLFGIGDYTIVDLPLTSAAQGYFLGRTLGADAVRLPGETTSQTRVIRTPEMLQESAESYDLIVNVDSWTEMSPEVANAYWSFAKSAGKAVLSINHEHNPLTVRSLYSSDPDARATRVPYWLRRGYVEEVITWR